MVSEKKYVQVIVPLKLAWEPYYMLVEDESVRVGDFVAVPFAGRRYIGVVSSCCDTLPESIEPSAVREIYSIHSEIPSLTARQLEFWRRIAHYYMCTTGEVLKMSCPSATSSYTSVRGKRAGKFSAAAASFEISPVSVSYQEHLAAFLSDIKPVMLESQADTDAFALLCGRILGLSWSETSSGGPDTFSSLPHGSVLWLVPDEATLKELEKKLRPLFGSCLLTFTRNMVPSKRLALESDIHRRCSFLLIGTRGALFLPFSSLGTVIVQDEHSSSYKQSGISPRYNARDSAVMLSLVHSCPIVLQSPTPSLESILNVRQNKYRHLCAGPSPLEKFSTVRVLFIDTRDQKRKNGMTGDIPRQLLPGWNNASGGDDAVAFAKLHHAMFPKSEELETQLSSLFPAGYIFSDDPVARPLPSGTKTVCVFGVDGLLTKNDFRADERALHEIFKIVEHLSDSLQRLVILTRFPSHSLFRPEFMGELDFETFFSTDRLLAERRELSLPPYTRMIDLRCRKEGVNSSVMEWMAGYVPAVSDSAYPLEDGWRVIFPKDRLLSDRKDSLMREVALAEKSLRCQGSVSFDVDP